VTIHRRATIGALFHVPYNTVTAAVPDRTATATIALPLDCLDSLAVQRGKARWDSVF
jgi:hypothetical protein